MIKTKIRMKRTFIFILTIALFSFAFTFTSHNPTGTKKEPWKQSQLIKPEILAATLKNTNIEKPYIISVGPKGIFGIQPGKGIKNAVEFGACSDEANLNNLKVELFRIEKDREIVIYCGCCPFQDCPNIRPAFKLLNEMNFTNAKLLDIPHNIMQDWIEKGYPMNE
jgi:thiosulfate/3-mercaptopyruvate sulfurtransferase